MNTATVTTTETTVTPAVKAPSKKSQAVAIFKAKLADRAAGLFSSNKEFRASVLVAIETELGVSRASASTMFNSAKKEAEAVDANLGLGRDPKKEKAPSTGKRGRPVGSKNKEKVVVEGAAAEVAAQGEAAPAATGDAPAAETVSA